MSQIPEGARPESDAEADAETRSAAVTGLDEARNRRARSHTAGERDPTPPERSETARVRDEAAARRDELADERDAAAQGRDELATTLESEIERLDLDGRTGNGARLTGMDVLMRAAIQRKRAAAARALAVAQREAAANDRERAALDRRQAALDREAAAHELALDGIDHLTGALRRRVGLAAIRREMDRTLRTSEPLVVAFVDVDGLKAVNESQGHAAGDGLLLAAAQSITTHLRSDDVIVRYGGDEFVCSLTGQDLAGVRKRFERIAVHLAKMSGATFSAGFAERQGGESLDDLIGRADNAMAAARRRDCWN